MMEFQTELFRIPVPPVSTEAPIHYRSDVSLLIGSIIKKSGYSRSLIAEKMSAVSGQPISEHMLNAWSSQARTQHNIPLYLVPSFELAVGQNALTDWASVQIGGRLLIGRDLLNAELGHLERVRDQARRQIIEIKRFMGADR